MRADNLILAALLLVAVVAPSAAFAQSAPPSSGATFSRQGIYSCNQNGSYAMSVGTINAVTGPSGTYVPVNDSAVTSNTAGILVNTGTLVYKECILREIVDRQAESALTGFNKRIFTSFTSSRNGKPMYPEVLQEDIIERNDEVIARALTNESLNTINPTYRQAVKRAILRAYQASTRARNQSLACPYQGDIAALQQAREGSFSFDGLMALGQPACNPLFAYQQAQQYTYELAANDTTEMMTRLGWSKGIYGVERTEADGTRRTLTPGYLVGNSVSLAMNSGYQRLINANDIGQMVGGLFAGFGAQIMSSSGGLAGAVTSSGGQPSYLQQMVRESADGLIGSAVNAALQILSAARQLEILFNQAVSAIATNLLSTANSIRGIEAQCWTLLIEHVCQAGTVSSSTMPWTCKDSGGNNLRIATSTTASKAIIDAQIIPIASSTQADIDASNQALTLIDRLIDSVTDTTSPDAQRLALLELDQLVAQNKLHSQQDVNQAQSRRDTLAIETAALVTKTATDWGDSTDPNVGWCNYNNPSVIQMWANRWKQ